MFAGDLCDLSVLSCESKFELLCEYLKQTPIILFGSLDLVAEAPVQLKIKLSRDTQPTFRMFLQLRQLTSVIGCRALAHIQFVKWLNIMKLVSTKYLLIFFVSLQKMYFVFMCGVSKQFYQMVSKRYK